MGNWTITVPEAGTNIVTDPECTALDFYNALSSTLTVDTTYARFGYTSLKSVTGNAAANEGANSDEVSATAGTTYTFSVYMRGSGNVALIVNWLTAGSVFISNTAGSANALTNTGWTRYTLSGTAPATTAKAVLYAVTLAQQSITFYIDGWQFEAQAYATTFMSGNRPGCRWNGLYNASTSTRDAQYRLGGREVDIESTYGVKINAVQGMGLPQIQNNLQTLALQPGAMFQSTKAMPRTLDLVISAQTNYGDAITTLHTRRNYINSLFGYDQYRGAQPVRLGYTGTGHTVYGEFRYAGGLEFTELNGRNEKMPLRLIGVDPFWYEDDQGQSVIDYQDSLNTTNVTARINGTWAALGSGFNDVVWSIVVDKQRGRIYFGGAFSTANGVTVNGVCYWNGTTFVAMGGTAGVSGGSADVYAMALAPNGDLWVGGDFTAAGGSTADGLARWNVVAETWTCFTNGTAGDIINAIAIDKNGLVYIGGAFLNWDGDADEDNIVSYNGTAFAQLSTGTNGAVNGLAIGKDGTTLYVGGNFTTPQTRLMSWNGSAFSAMGSGASSVVRALMVDNDGSVYAGGDFTTTPSTTYIAKWDGNAWSALGTGVDGAVYSIGLLEDNAILVSGNITAAGGLTTSYFAIWNRTSWATPDISSIALTRAIAANGSNIYVGAGSASAIVSGITTVTNGGSTEAFPVITITGTTTAGASSTLKWIENQSTKQVMYLNLTVQAGETVVIDLSPGRKTITSNWRGRIYDNPLSNSDFSNWHLLPGANSIVCFMTGTITGAQVIMSWSVQHLGVDGSV